jgi:hypothetical protein
MLDSTLGLPVMMTTMVSGYASRHTFSRSMPETWPRFTSSRTMSKPDLCIRARPAECLSGAHEHFRRCDGRLTEVRHGVAAETHAERRRVLQGERFHGQPDAIHEAAHPGRVGIRCHDHEFSATQAPYGVGRTTLGAQCGRYRTNCRLGHAIGGQGTGGPVLLQFR